MTSSTLSLNPTHSLVPNIYAASFCSIAISGAFFAARIVSRRLTRISPDWSDYTLAVGVVCCWGLAIVDIWMTTVGLGTHLALVQQRDPSLSGVILMLKVFILNEVFYDVGIASIKISILLLYRSIFIGKVFVSTSWFLMGLVCAWCLGNLLPSIFSCRPISGFWNLKMDPPPVCIDKRLLYILGSTVNIATDLAILCLPVRQVIKLHLSTRYKIGVISSFLLGGLVCVVSIYRFTVLLDANSPDLTWEFASVLNWSSAELSTAVASACLPVLRPILRKILPGASISTGRRAYTDPADPEYRGGLRSPTSHTFGEHSDRERLAAEGPTTSSLSSWASENGINVTTTVEMSTIRI